MKVKEEWVRKQMDESEGTQHITQHPVIWKFSIFNEGSERKDNHLLHSFRKWKIIEFYFYEIKWSEDGLLSLLRWIE